MKVIRLSVLFVACALLQALPAFGQPGEIQMPQVPRLFGQFAPKAGVWAEYAVVDSGGKESKMRMAIVGTEGDSHWYEVWRDEEGSRNIIKMLVKGDPNDSENIERMIIKSGDGQPMEMPRDFVVMGRKMAVHMFQSRTGVSDKPDAGVSVKEIGAREVTVPAGTFKTTQSSIVDESGKEIGSFDISSKIPPFGVVSSKTDQSTMKLLAYGSDAVTAIRAEPVPMMTPPGMPAGMPRGAPPGMWPQGGPPMGGK